MSYHVMAEVAKRRINRGVEQSAQKALAEMEREWAIRSDVRKLVREMASALCIPYEELSRPSWSAIGTIYGGGGSGGQFRLSLNGVHRGGVYRGNSEWIDPRKDELISHPTIPGVRYNPRMISPDAIRSCS